MSTNSQVSYTLIDYNGQKARKYPDGSIRDSRGRTLTRPPILDDHTITTTDRARALVRSREEKRARIIAEAANVAVERREFIDRYGPDAYIAEIAYAQTVKAMTPDDPKSTAAANFVFEQAGISAKQAANGDNQASDSSIRSVLSDIACIAKAMTIDNVDAKCSYLKHGSVVDGSVVDGSVVDDDDVKKDSEDKSGGGG